MYTKVIGWILGQGMYPGFMSYPGQGADAYGRQQTTDLCFTLTLMFLSHIYVVKILSGLKYNVYIPSHSYHWLHNRLIIA